MIAHISEPVVLLTGFDLVLDTTVSRELSLLESFKEFISRKQRYDQGDKTALPMLTGICPGKLAPVGPGS